MKMDTTLLIVSTTSDMSAYKMATMAQASFAQVEHRSYNSLLFSMADNSTQISHAENTLLFARQPYSANNIEQNYVTVLNSLLQKNHFKYVFDHQLYQNTFVAYEDKLHQSLLFDQLGMPYAPMHNPLTVTDNDFPLIAKKRLSSRGNSNFILKNMAELDEFLLTNDITTFIFQSYFPLKGDFRILTLGSAKLIGIVERKVVIKDGNRATVEVVGEGFVTPDMVDNCLHLTHALGAELCGFDIGQKENGEYFFIEYNTSPQFMGFERETGVDVCAQIIEYMQQQ